jgi:hypothetical protein
VSALNPFRGAARIGVDPVRAFALTLSSGGEVGERDVECRANVLELVGVERADIPQTPGDLDLAPAEPACKLALVQPLPAEFGTDFGGDGLVQAGPFACTCICLLHATDLSTERIACQGAIVSLDA